MKINNRKKGFTIIEVLVAIFIFSLSIGLIVGLIFLTYQSRGYAQEQAKAVDEARRGVDAMIKEIRETRTADNGSYPIERADDRQFVFYADIDNDGEAERIRYFLGTITSNNQIKECTAPYSDGSCSVTFSNLLTVGTLKSAQVRVSLDGDLDASNEYVAVSADGTTLDDDMCRTGCLHCAGVWQGSTVFDVTSQASNGSVTFTANANSYVSRQCPASNPNHAMKAQFELSWAEEIVGQGNELKRGVVEPVGSPASYPLDQEVISLITPYVRNNPPIFKYYDSEGIEITQLPDRLEDTKLMKIYLVVNIDPNRPPNEFQLESFAQLRNLKEE
ncbi:MAG: prepilin-type N-terminal cleavage/methylation domain-containing protein [Patescibacteria group bacterium]